MWRVAINCKQPGVREGTNKSGSGIACMPLDLGPSRLLESWCLASLCVCFVAGVVAPGAVHVHTPWPGARTAPGLFTACYSQCTRPTTTTTGETARACVVGQACCCRVPPAQAECGAEEGNGRRAIALIASGSSRTRARAAAVACPVSRCAGLCSAPGGPPASAEAFLSPPGPRAPYIFWLFGRSVGRPTSTPSGSSLSPP